VRRRRNKRWHFFFFLVDRCQGAAAYASILLGSFRPARRGRVGANKARSPVLNRWAMQPALMGLHNVGSFSLGYEPLRSVGLRHACRNVQGLSITNGGFGFWTAPTGRRFRREYFTLILLNKSERMLPVEYCRFKCYGVRSVVIKYGRSWNQIW
jgi:hypothetical protein